ncbi:DUF6130 family protein [Amycolatopsis rubida]|uniref:DUF4399 domain-containing protein n=1 Tax=Amycolatopsis rubida TaxID=112413 RepID=A0A1I5HRC4_9PSEU|nr:DUF6130 family protein [Amycolatopsis rubida]SFO50874.1 hypothetical protein SAMN05421854_10232 [Amycolatopsis rubida]
MPHFLRAAILGSAVLLATACSASAAPPVASAPPPAAAPGWPPAPVVPLPSQPPPALAVDAPLPEQLAKGLVVLRYRAENLRIVPVYGPAALEVSPRIGHIHVTVDDAPWHWADGSGEPLIIQALPPGPHKVWIGLADPTHQVLDSKTVSFVVPVGGHH